MKKRKEEDLFLDTVTTTRGVQVICQPIAAEIEATEANLRASIEWPEVPTRTITDVAGATIDEDLSSEYVESPRATDKEKAAWAEYLIEQGEALTEFNAKRAHALPRLLAWKGIKLADPSLGDKWAEEHEWMGLDVPSEPRERALHFLLTEIFGNPEEDTRRILLGIYRASGYDEEVLDRLEASFRAQMGRAKRLAAEDGKKNSGVSPAEGPPGLVEQPGMDYPGDGT